MATEAVFKALIDAKYESNMRKVLAGDKRAFKRFTADLNRERKKLRKLGLVGGKTTPTARSVRALKEVHKLNREQDKIERKRKSNLEKRKKLAKQERRDVERARLQFGLSALFGGMALQRAVAPVTRGGLQDLGLTDLFQEAAADIGRTTLIDTGAFDVILNKLTGIFDLPSETKTAIGEVAFATDALGLALQAAGQFTLGGLGFGALKNIFGNGGGAGVAAGAAKGASAVRAGAAAGAASSLALSVGSAAIAITGAVVIAGLFSHFRNPEKVFTPGGGKVFSDIPGTPKSARGIMPGFLNDKSFISKAIIDVENALGPLADGFGNLIKKSFDLAASFFRAKEIIDSKAVPPPVTSRITRGNISRAGLERGGNQVINDNANINITINGVSPEERPEVFRRVAAQALAGRSAQRLLSARFRR